jgi:hypothetical protein
MVALPPWCEWCHIYVRIVPVTPMLLQQPLCGMCARMSDQVAVARDVAVLPVQGVLFHWGCCCTTDLKPRLPLQAHCSHQHQLEPSILLMLFIHVAGVDTFVSFSCHELLL